MVGAAALSAMASAGMSQLAGGGVAGPPVYGGRGVDAGSPLLELHAAARRDTVIARVRRGRTMMLTSPRGSRWRAADHRMDGSPADEAISMDRNGGDSRCASFSGSIFHDHESTEARKGGSCVWKTDTAPRAALRSAMDGVDIGRGCAGAPFPPRRSFHPALSSDRRSSAFFPPAEGAGSGHAEEKRYDRSR